MTKEQDTGIPAGLPSREPAPPGMCEICRERKATKSFAGQKICETCGYAIQVMTAGAMAGVKKKGED